MKRSDERQAILVRFLQRRNRCRHCPSADIFFGPWCPECQCDIYTGYPKLSGNVTRGNPMDDAKKLGMLTP